MSRSGSLQRRTTYLISLTLVKVETVGVGGAGHGHAPAEEERQFTDEEEEETELEEEEDDEDSLREVGKERVKLERGEIGPSGGTPAKASKDLWVPERPTPPSIPVTHVKGGAGGVVEGGAEKEAGQPRAVPPKALRVPDLCSVDPCRTPTRSNIPLRIGQRPVSLMKAHSDAANRCELRGSWEGGASSVAEPRSPASPGGRDTRLPEADGRSRPLHRHGNGTKVEGKGAGGAVKEVFGGRAVGGAVGGAVSWDSPRNEKLKAGSASLPAPLTLAPKPPRKGKSRTLDNSDIRHQPEDLSKGAGGPISPALGPAPDSTPAALQVQAQRASARDHRMLKFISGIFAKSTPVPPSPVSAASPCGSIQRESSEEDASCALGQEWTLSRSVPELHLGVVGSLRSGKSALIHKFVTGSYLPLENQEGGRFKKEVLTDGQSHLLLIREELMLSDALFCSWVDAVILVFSLENEASFQEVYKNYSHLCAHRNITEIPLIVVGTQDKISNTNPRVIEDARARQLCADVRRCSYYETCATYGLNVERVFSEAAQRMAAMKRQMALAASSKSLPSSPSHSGASTPVSGTFPGQVRPADRQRDTRPSLNPSQACTS
ncbi:hypothetical protein GJAV_G00194590 [Gymnothorax javanicus]|nr:hypothetical protein GJAV_G00194590 [Gymnothorax javanicus]